MMKKIRMAAKIMMQVENVNINTKLKEEIENLEVGNLKFLS